YLPSVSRSKKSVIVVSPVIGVIPLATLPSHSADCYSGVARDTAWHVSCGWIQHDSHAFFATDPPAGDTLVPPIPVDHLDGGVHSAWAGHRLAGAWRQYSVFWPMRGAAPRFGAGGVCGT